LSGDEAAIETAQDRGLFARQALGWGGLFWSALGALVSLAICLWIDTLIEQFFARSAALGWVGIALVALIGLAAWVLLMREILALGRQRHIARLHRAFAQARGADDREAARKLVTSIATLYAARPTTARARANLADLTREIVDGRDLIDIAERGLMHPLDAEAAREIAAAARRVSVVTAISPRALIDVIFVAGQAIYIIRRLAEIYGGRPGLMGFIRLARSVGAHLAITGGMAVGDSLVQQVLGHGIAARLSARLGEGVLNGMLTARVGLSAMAVCRPMPFAVEKPPGISDVAPFLFSKDKADTEKTAD
jgi:putative membrane protein